jgi:hypothetical protein
MNSMLAVYQEVSGPTKIWSSLLRIKETHLWDLEGFVVQDNKYLKPEWILWVAYLGICTVECNNECIAIHHRRKEESAALPFINGLSTERNGLISLNFRSVSELKGNFDEMEQGFKQNSLGRLLPGLSYKIDPQFGILGVDEVFDEVKLVKGLDEDGFLEMK